MALTPQEEQDVRTVLEAYKNGKTVEQLPQLSVLNGGEIIELMKGGISYRANVAMLAASQPDSNGVYPDVPLNRVTIKRSVGQLSTQVVLDDNTGLVDVLKQDVFPCIINRDGQIVTRLNGSDITKTADGLPAVLNDWTMPVMTRMGGFWFKYEYDAANNIKLFKISPYKVRGYKYFRRRFRGCFNGTVKNIDGKNYLLSNDGEWTTQNLNVINYHDYAKNLGGSFRAIAMQDQEVYRLYFWLLKQTYNSQSVYTGITNVNNTNWSTFDQSADGGQTSYAQFHKTGILNDISGHEGEKEIDIANFPGGAIKVKPQKFLWIENGLSGPYFLRATGYLKRNRVWYRVSDLSKIAFSVTGDYEPVCEEVAGNDTGYILENFEETLIPTLLGASSSTGMADYFWRENPQPAAQIYIPVLVGNANYGSRCGVSCLSSGSAPSGAWAKGGSALASEDSTDRIPEGEIAV